MRKAIFWGFLGTLAEPGAPSPNPLDPGQYRVYPDAAATLALCAYKGYQNYMLAEGFPRLTELLPKLHLERFFPGRVVSGRVELAGSHGEGLYRRAELAAHFPGIASQNPMPKCKLTPSVLENSKTVRISSVQFN